MRKPFLLLSAPLILALILVSNFKSSAQITTATLSGFVKDSKGITLPSATVTVEFPDAGIKQVVITKSGGRFTIPNLRVGGPYRITVEHVSYKTSVTNDVVLDLGLNNTIDVVMEEKTTAIENVTVVARSRVFDDKRTGASTNISNRLLKNLPTISRSADDYIRLTPSASVTYNGMSFAGRNGQYNNFSLDGAVFNNPFGLDAPTPGGQTNAQPISLDAIDQIQVNLAPYDVTQAGFTGAGVNTVTKSGSNTITGTAYGFYRFEAFTGKEVDGVKFSIPDLKQLQLGTTLGGPIIKNKLFYFLSFETDQRRDEATAYRAKNNSNANQPTTARVLEQDLIDVSTILKNKFGYETGAYQGFTHDQVNYKWLAKIDWNISDVHKLSFTYNGLDASKDKPAHPNAIGRRGPDYTTLQFRNSGYEITNKLNSFITELKSNFKGNAANKLRLVYTRFRDRRHPFSAPFPVINISKFGSRYIVAGHEPFSIHNTLDQDAVQVTNDFNIYKKNHTYTIGASYESFKFGNSFNLTGYGFNMFLGDVDISTFKTNVPTSAPLWFGVFSLDQFVTYARNRAIANQWVFYDISVGQLSAYLQDEWQAAENFKVTYGVRFDKPVYNDANYKAPNIQENVFAPNAGTFLGTSITGNPTVPNNDNLVIFDKYGNRIQNGVGKDLDNTRLPNRKVLLSPRIGFNWDVSGKKSFQLRGGTGLFTGRFPFVWIGNAIGNPTTTFYCATDKKFKWPQVWRTNLGADFKIPAGTVFTIDLAYTKDVHAMMVRNYMLGKPGVVLHNGSEGDKRTVYRDADQGNDRGPSAQNVYVFTNTDVGYQFNISVQAQHSFKKGLFLLGGYNYLKAEDASSVSAEISSDAFDRNPILNNSNQARLTPSLYGNTHRFFITALKKFDYGKDNKYATTVSLFGSWSSGNRYTYTYAGDINNDESGTNDLMYVPTDTEIDAMRFDPITDVNGVTQSPAAQRAAFKAFISQDEYLRVRRGQYTEKYGATTPWFNQVDIRVLQDLNFGKGKRKQTLQLSFDLINAGNLISSKWGVKKYATTSFFYQPLGVSTHDNAGKFTNNPIYSFDPSLTKTFVSSPDLQSRWQLQLGLRYIF